MWRAATIAVLVVNGCKSSQPVAEPPQAEPAKASEAEGSTTPAAATMSLAEAKKAVAEFTTRHAQPDSDEPLAHPKSLDEVLEILGRDQFGLFAAGADYAKAQPGTRAQALYAQIELSWGDACMLLADLLRESAARARQRKARLESRAEQTAAENAELRELSASIAEETKTAKAFMTIAADHFAAGSEVARQVIANSPEEYSGYRVAADFYRLQQDWANFDAMVKKIEATNPNSIGLVFLRGMAAAERDNNRHQAAELLREAIDRDPGFTRAQAMLVVWAESVPSMYAEYQKLKMLNPQHQIVVWAGKKIEGAHAAWRARNPQ